MYKLTVLYKHPADNSHFEKYYAEKHLPLTQQLQGLSRMELTQFTSAPGGGQPAYYRMAELYFANEAQMIDTIGSPEGQMVVNDLHNFATGGVDVLIGTVPAEM